MTMGFLSTRIELAEYNRVKQEDERDQYPPMVEFEYLFVREVMLIIGKKKFLRKS